MAPGGALHECSDRIGGGLNEMQRPHGRLTKHDVKDDEAVIWFFRAWAWAESNYEKLVAGLAILVVAVLAVVYVRYRGAQEAQAAVDALGDVQVSLASGDMDRAILGAEELVDRYGDEQGARHALALLGSFYYSSGRFAEARGAYERYLEAHGPGGPAGYGAWSGVAACLEEVDKLSEAATKYAEYADAQSGSPYAPLALKEAARCYVTSGLVSEAEAALRRIVDAYPQSSVAREAKSQLQMHGVAAGS